VITRLLTSLVLVAGVAGCATAAPEDDAGGEPAVRLAATLVSPTDIALEWRGKDPDAVGLIVEVTTEKVGRYTILRFLPPEQSTFAHPDLIPETSFYYRIRPYYGPASRPLEVALPPGPFDERSQEDSHDWANPRTVPGKVATEPIRDTRGGGEPTDLAATVMHANGIKFTWTDHASDEEGYLLEARPDKSAGYTVAAVLDPNINSAGLITLPDEKKASFRVRTFYYGKPSNVAHQRTGPDPSDN